MNEEFDNFASLLNEDFGLVRKKLELTQLKLTHHFYYTCDNISDLISISIELYRYFDPAIQEMMWFKKTTHTYKIKTEDKTERIKDTSIINKIQEYDLRRLANNYFTDEEPENLSFWEIEYNSKFRIVGTFDNVVPEYKELSNLLGLDKLTNI